MDFGDAVYYALSQVFRAPPPVTYTYPDRLSTLALKPYSRVDEARFIPPTEVDKLDELLAEAAKRENSNVLFQLEGFPCRTRLVVRRLENGGPNFDGEATVMVFINCTEEQFKDNEERINKSLNATKKLLREYSKWFWAVEFLKAPTDFLETPGTIDREDIEQYKWGDKDRPDST